MAVVVDWWSSGGHWSDSRRGPFTAIYYSHNESQRFYWSFFSFFLFLFLSCQSNLAVNCSPWQWIAAPFICQSFKDWPRNGSLNSIHIHCEFSVTVTATMALVLSAIDMQKKRRRRATIGFEQVTRKGSDNDWLWITRSATTAAAILWLYVLEFFYCSLGFVVCDLVLWFIYNGVCYLHHRLCSESTRVRHSTTKSKSKIKF